MAAPRGSIEYSVNDTPYGGDASIPANAFFLALAAISLIACLGFALKTRRYILFSSAMCIACLFEIISYGLRFEPSWAFAAYVLNFSLSTIAPVFVTIAIHFATGPILEVLGREHAVLPPDSHMRLFAWCDATALLIQIVGLGVTFNGAHSTTPWIILLTKSGHTGQSILSIGLLLQTLLLVTALSLLAMAYVRAGKAHREYGYTTFHPGAPGYMPLNPRFRVFLVVIPLAGTCILARCIYRTAAAWDGIGGSLARSQVAWIMAEGLMLTEALVSLAFFHPAIWAQDINKGTLQNSGMGAGGARSQAYDLEGMRDSSYGGKMGKRFSSGTMLSLADTMEYNSGDLAASEMVDATPTFSAHLIAASEAGSWDGGSPKRQSVVLNANPYYRYEEAGASELDVAPVAQPPPHLEPRRYSQDITAETRHLSPMELEAEEERRDAESYITPLRQQQSKKSTISSEDDWEVGSIVLPPRVPSKRDPTKPRDLREEQLEDLAMSSVYSESVGGPSRSATMRTAATDDDWQVPAFELPPRMPSKKAPMLMQQRLQGRVQTDELERSDSVSLYSQP